MIRRIAREIVLQSLFQIDFTKCEPAFALAAAVEFQTEGDEDKAVVDVHKEEELAKAKEYAAKAGLEYSFQKCDLGPLAHPNTVLFRLTGADGSECEIIGSSVGGGQVKVTEIDGYPVELTGRLPAILTVHHDTHGIIALVTSALANVGINIATMRVFRSDKGGLASMVIECDQDVPDHIINLISLIKPIESVRFIASVL